MIDYLYMNNNHYMDTTKQMEHTVFITLLLQQNRFFNLLALRTKETSLM